MRWPEEYSSDSSSSSEDDFVMHDWFPLGASGRSAPISIPRKASWSSTSSSEAASPSEAGHSMSRSSSPIIIPKFADRYPYHPNYDLSVGGRSQVSYDRDTPSPSGASQAEHTWDDDMQWTPTSKHRFANGHFSDAELSTVSSPASPSRDSMSSSSTNSGHEQDDVGSSRMKAIDYFEYFSKEKPQLDIDLHYRIDRSIIEQYSKNAGEYYELKQQGFSRVSIKHKDLPFGLATRSDAQPGRASLVLYHKNHDILHKDEFQSMYKKLIIALSEKHAEDFSIELFNDYEYQTEQRRLLSWLDKEIYAPYDSLPVIGLSRYSFESGPTDQFLLKPNQLHLIRYFSEALWHPTDEEFIEQTVNPLIESYKSRPKIPQVETMHPPKYLEEQKSSHSKAKLKESWNFIYGLWYA
ncbi:hypothetical protein PGTUg99_031833 [Puccinia graminis f. sp. tritici]|uniref:Uncharacterized protein n=1 Tax=Puccinia graminis f. sp. tritici TaxID=56615 RepID=A0A5B0RUU4_PUCGR|nr:hypothetical protein PGTUg99_031833 [Puccinia graminis f. sp. tritici]